MKKIIIPNEKELQKQLDEYWENTAKEREGTHTKKCIKNIWKVRKLIEKGNLLRKTGFYKTLSILPSDGAIKLSEFYAKLTKISYYNLFLRVKSDLLKKKIIEIGYEQKPVRHIRLTKNGVVIKHLLKELIGQMDKGVDE